MELKLNLHEEKKLQLSIEEMATIRGGTENGGIPIDPPMENFV